MTIRRLLRHRVYLAPVLLAVAAVACGGGENTTGVPSSGREAARAGETTTTERERSPRNEGILTEDAVGSIDVWTWIGQQRHLEGTRRVTVPVQFLSDDPMTVTSIALRAPHFEPLPPETKDSLLQPGRKVALQVDLGPARCGELPDARPEVHLTMREGDGEPVDLVLPVPTWLLDDLRERDCAVADLTDAVSVSFGDHGEPDGIALDTELVVERRGSTEPIEIERIAGSVLLTLSPQSGDTPVETVPTGASGTRIPVQVTATRCDAHGLAGSQKTFVFSVWVAVGDEPPVYLEVMPAPDLEAAMRATLDACIQAGG